VKTCECISLDFPHHPPHPQAPRDDHQHPMAPPTTAPRETSRHANANPTTPSHHTHKTEVISYQPGLKTESHRLPRQRNLTGPGHRSRRREVSSYMRPRRVPPTGMIFRSKWRKLTHQYQSQTNINHQPGEGREDARSSRAAHPWSVREGERTVPRYLLNYAIRYYLLGLVRNHST